MQHVLLSEFDIDKGSALRATRQWVNGESVEGSVGTTYTAPLYNFCSLYSHDHTHFLQVYGYEDDYLAELMLPEGSHRREEDKSFALLHRDMFQNRVEHINAGHVVSSDKPFSVQLYDLKNNLVWVNWCAAKLKVRLLEGGDVLGGDDDDDTAKVSQTNH